MKRNFVLNYGQRALIVSILACVVASWSRLSNHQLWQDIIIIISSLIFGSYGWLLASNWRGISRRYSGTQLSSKIRGRREVRRFKLIRIGGVLLVLGAVAAIASSTFWIIALLNEPV